MQVKRDLANFDLYSLIDTPDQTLTSEFEAKIAMPLHILFFPSPFSPLTHDIDYFLQSTLLNIVDTSFVDPLQNLKQILLLSVSVL